MVIKPVEFGMIQQQNLVSSEQAAENNRPVANQSNIQTTIEHNVEAKAETVTNKDDTELNSGSFDAKEKSNNEYDKDRAKGKNNKKSDGRVFIKGQGSTDFDIKI
ncbi:hypothetical protein [Lachnospira sp.]|jgi:hypothetical protein|uniref:hypothetical protein n=1 Tax=Lachnospira sp. TaxID=2049031 RepID=UPI00257ABD87|nr:hypothetical protein [Lachnospira sp.]